jgi:hypothetical protein
MTMIAVSGMIYMTAIFGLKVMSIKEIKALFKKKS